MKMLKNSCPILVMVFVLVASWALPGQSLGVMAQETVEVGGSLDEMLNQIIEDAANESVEETEVAELTAKSMSSSECNCASRWADIERRVEELERTSIDASEAEAIAVRVVQRYATLLKVAVNKPEGGQRIETVQFSSPTDTQQFRLNPGETLSSYTDASTGQTVRIGQPTSHVVSSAFSVPVPTWRTSHVVMQSTPAPVTTMRTYAVRPLVQTVTAPSTQATTTYRRGLFGRQIMRTAVSSSPAASGPTCRVVDGQVVCN